MKILITESQFKNLVTESVRRDRFIDSCERKVNKLLIDIEGLKTLKSKNMYNADSEELMQIVDALKNKVQDLEDFYNQSEDYKSFRLKEDLINMNK